MGRVAQDCERARAWISAELDGELSEFESTLLQGHLHECRACGAFRTSAGTFTRELRQAPLEPLAHPIAVPGRRRIVLQPLRVPAVAAMAVSIFALGSLFAVLHSRDILGRSASAAVSARDLSQDRHALQRYKRSTALARVRVNAARATPQGLRETPQVPTLLPGARQQP
jgi:predicted anti-sigma-YlaC factor YlaD